MTSAAVQILYTNYRGETGFRSVVPERMWFGETEWHRSPQWFMDAYDIERHAVRSFALQDVHAWKPDAAGTTAPVGVRHV